MWLYACACSYHVSLLVGLVRELSVCVCVRARVCAAKVLELFASPTYSLTELLRLCYCLVLCPCRAAMYHLAAKARGNNAV